MTITMQASTTRAAVQTALWLSSNHPRFQESSEQQLYWNRPNIQVHNPYKTHVQDCNVHILHSRFASSILPRTAHS